MGSLRKSRSTQQQGFISPANAVIKAGAVVKITWIAQIKIVINQP